jgi:hypothetical protein
VLGIFEIGFWELFASGWLQTAILLIFASWVARITGMCHWYPALSLLFMVDLTPIVRACFESAMCSVEPHLAPGTDELLYEVFVILLLLRFCSRWS